MSHFALNSDMLTVLWIVLAVLVVAYVMRRRSRKRKIF
jgi:hypothetical protein